MIAYLSQYFDAPLFIDDMMTILTPSPSRPILGDDDGVGDDNGDADNDGDNDKDGDGDGSKRGIWSIWVARRWNPEEKD